MKRVYCVCQQDSALGSSRGYVNRSKVNSSKSHFDELTYHRSSQQSSLSPLSTLTAPWWWPASTQGWWRHWTRRCRSDDPRGVKKWIGRQTIGQKTDASGFFPSLFHFGWHKIGPRCFFRFESRSSTFYYRFLTTGFAGFLVAYCWIFTFL